MDLTTTAVLNLALGAFGTLVGGLLVNLVTPYVRQFLSGAGRSFKDVRGIAAAMEVAKLEAWLQRPGLLVAELFLWFATLTLFGGGVTFLMSLSPGEPEWPDLLMVIGAAAMIAKCIDSIGTAYWSMRTPVARLNFLIRRGGERHQDFALFLKLARDGFEINPPPGR